MQVPTVRRPSSSTICRTTGIRVPSVRHLSNCWDVELLGRRTTGIPSSSTSQQFDKFELLGRRTGETSNYCATPRSSSLHILNLLIYWVSRGSSAVVSAGRPMFHFELRFDYGSVFESSFRGCLPGRNTSSTL